MTVAATTDGPQGCVAGVAGAELGGSCQGHEYANRHRCVCVCVLSLANVKPELKKVCLYGGLED